MNYRRKDDVKQEGAGGRTRAVCVRTALCPGGKQTGLVAESHARAPLTRDLASARQNTEWREQRERRRRRRRRTARRDPLGPS